MKFGHVLPPLVVLGGILTASWVHQSSQGPRSFHVTETLGVKPGWTFSRSRSLKWLTLNYKSTDGVVEFAGLCPGEPIFLFLKYPDIPGSRSSAIDGKKFVLVDLAHGGLMYDDWSAFDDLVAAKRSITISMGDWKHSFAATPDIRTFVAECRKLNASRTA